MADTAGGVTRLSDAPSQAGIAPCVQNHPKGTAASCPSFFPFQRDLTPWRCSAKAAPREPPQRAWAGPSSSGTPAGPGMEAGDGGGQLSSQQRQTGAGGQDISETSPEWNVRFAARSSPLRLSPLLLQRDCTAVLLRSCRRSSAESGPNSQATPPLPAWEDTGTERLGD